MKIWIYEFKDDFENPKMELSGQSAWELQIISELDLAYYEMWLRRGYLHYSEWEIPNHFAPQ